MATFRQMKQLVEPFLLSHTDFVMRQREIFRVPIHHLMVGMEFERTGHVEQVALRWNVKFLFAPAPYYSAGLSVRMDRSWGIIDTPDIQSKILREMEIAVDEVIAERISLKSVLEIDEKVIGHFNKLWAKSRGLLYAALGDFRQSIGELQAHADQRTLGAKNWLENPTYPVGSKRWEQTRAVFSKSEEDVREIEKLIELLDRNDSHGVATLLHAWEDSAVQEHKLERYWQPSPFPFELS